MLVDASVLLDATDADSPFPEPARASRRPLQPADAWAQVEDWLAADPVWTPAPGSGHEGILGRLVTELDLRGNLISDAVVVAMCIEHGLDIVSADSGLARFGEISWINPVAT